MTDEEKANVKYRLSDIGEQVGELALEYISELEKENAEVKELLKTFLLIADKDKKVSQMEFQLCVAESKQFLNRVVEK